MTFLRNLYWKIFLWFWVTMVLIVTAVAFSTHQYLEATRSDGNAPPGQAMFAGAGLIMLAERLQKMDPTRIPKTIRRFKERTGIDAYLVDANGTDLLGRPLPAALSARPPRERIVIQSIRTQAGADLRLLANLSDAQVRGPPTGPGLRQLERGPPPLGRELFWIRLSVAIVVSGLVCYLLAQYLTKPIRKLRGATERFSLGDLSVRVGAEMGSRRDEIADLGRDFDTMASRIESLVSSQNRLLSDISHELRSPLARLQVALELARKRSPTAQAELDRIALESERLNELIGQILAFQRLENSGRARDSQRIDLAELLGDIVADAQYEARGEERAIEILTSEDICTTGNPDQLRSAVENVVRNALRYTRPGTVVEVQLERVQEQAPWCCIRVRDHGPGVAPEALPHLFEAFFRADDARDRGSGGHGLGLAIAERCIQLHAGRVVARNHPETGLVIEMYLPLV